ncbi:CaiB/BaiF CoA-transferase family protein [Halorussus sp. MSC15.2]|uniref:CaiB/BaiF CoA transferase family protein n=1 Tax=Halorussus sp. MSC15.2 TaxID=2283638 RepID=UPI0013D1F27D|nr:CoA transferase [Halorussus sp. MSC15.2]NEU55663.1 CoA transferase [Halorussus sp. MSC15.2]
MGTDTNDSQPLSDVRVLELGNIVAGPFASVMLADLGAEVVKVERPGSGDVLRSAGEAGPPMFDALNRNKRSIELDLKSDAGREAFLDLADRADVVVENLGPGVADRLGIGYDELSERNPELVYLSIKGFLDGPYGDRAGMDVVAEAMSGLMSMTGELGRKPVRVGTSIADMGAAMYGVMGVLVALRERERTGEGRRVDGPLFEAAASWMGYWITYADRYGRDHPSLGASHPTWALYDVFRVGGEDDWLFLGVTTERHWPALCRAIDREDLLADERFETSQSRLDHKAELTETVAEELRDRDRESVLAALLAEDVPAAPVNDPSDLVDDDHLDAVDLLAEFDSAEDGESLQTVMTPVHGDGIAPAQRLDPPELGEHTEEILRTAGLDDDAIAALRNRGAFGSE